MTFFDLTLLLLISNSVHNTMTGPDTSLLSVKVADDKSWKASQSRQKQGLLKCKLLCTFVVVIVSATGTAQTEGPSPGSKSLQETTDTWLEEHYDAVLQQVFPRKLDLRPFPKDTKYVLVGFSQDAFRTSDFWFSIEYRYDGTAAATTRIAEGKSIEQQLRRLGKQLAATTTEKAAANLRIREYHFSDKERPELRTLCQDFEEIRMSPDIYGPLISDPDRYDFWLMSNYGQELSMTLYGFGPGKHPQPHPLVNWFERFREVMVSNVGDRPN